LREPNSAKSRKLLNWQAQTFPCHGYIAAAKCHAVSEEGVIREIAEALDRGLKMPVVAMSPEEEAAGNFG
jgi:hypothetical protein